MLPCQKNCHSYCVGCHKACPHFRAMQEQQRRDLARKKEYLRRADESCRTVLHQCRAAGGYLGPLPYGTLHSPPLTVYYIIIVHCGRFYHGSSPDDRYGLSGAEGAAR